MSDYRKKLKEIISDDKQLKEIDPFISGNKTTHKVFYECLHYGLSIDETFFIIDTHRSLFFNPSVKNLRKLFIHLGKDKDALEDAIEFIQEYYDLLYERIHPGIEGFLKDDHIVYEFRDLLRKNGNSIDELRMNIDALFWKSNEEDNASRDDE